MPSGTLYLIPTPLGECDLSMILPDGVRQIIRELTVFAVENQKTARHFLKLAGTGKPIQQITLYDLNEHTTPEEVEEILKPLLAGSRMGLLSEAGCPAIADPGAALVKMAHSHNIRVVPLAGPSSILLSLMASGLEGQRFAFHGYLPVDAGERKDKILQLEKESRTRRQTQIFIETPYRNLKLFEALLSACAPGTQLCIASSLTGNQESIRTKTIAQWKKHSPDIEKRPAIFLLKG